MSSPPDATSVVLSVGTGAGLALVHVLYRDSGGKLHLDWPRERMGEAIADQGGHLWVDFETSDEAGIREVEQCLRDVFRFHHLAIEDAIEETHVPKVDDWGSYLYVVFSVPRVDPDSAAIELQELDVFLGSNYLVTYHASPMPILDRERENIRHDPRDRLRHGTDHLLFRILELAVDQSLAVIEEFDERVDAIQNEVIEHPSAKVIRSIFRIKRAAIQLHRTLTPQREVLNRLARDPYQPIQADHRVYFRDLYDHVVRIHDISESLRDLISGTLETYLSVVSNRTNDIMKTLTMVTVMFLPMSFLAGFFGMNFFGESLSFKAEMARGFLFWSTCVVMTISPCIMWVYARRKKWF
ncbi:MAG: magnesium/cobalt transporter CorA [Isosphaeraceae bacterium]